MKHFIIVCLAALAVASTARPAEAGRRARRAARRTAGAAAVVYARPTAVAVAAPVAAPRGPGDGALPDLTVTQLAAQGDVLVITVANVGRAPSPLTSLDLTLRRPSSGLLLGAQSSRVLPLAVGQSVRIRISSVPAADVHALVVVDPLDGVAEMSELNNNRSLAIAPRPITPPVLEDDAVWRLPSPEAIAPGRPT